MMSLVFPIPTLSTAFCLWEEEGRWYCVRGDFTSNEASAMGVGETPCDAFNNLMESLQTLSGISQQIEHTVGYGRTFDCR